MVTDPTKGRGDASVSFWGRLERLLGIDQNKGAAGVARAPTISEADARDIAATWATTHGKRWTVPATATPGDEGTRRLWVVQSNALGKGYSLIVTIDAETGIVIAHRELPR